MKKMFNQLSDKLYSLLNHDEYLIASFYGENSQFIRFNAATIRQTGLVDDGSLSLKYMDYKPIVKLLVFASFYNGYRLLHSFFLLLLRVF